MYYLWLDNAQAGPFTLAQIAEQWRTGRVTDLTLYWEEGNADWGVLLTPVLIGIIILIHVFWSRASARYQVTTRRVSLETGLFTRSSRELRIEDIRSIAARANVFGIGDIEFSTAARAEAEVSFQGLSHVERVRDLVKDLQNRTRV
jgi:uncharacterized membrane protein YdbT with pleckstrin-like domain